MNKKIRTITSLALFGISRLGVAQLDTTQKLDDLSLEDLMNVKIVSASRKEEKTFDAPLSVGSVSRDEILRAGSTSIMEALRLIPGLIVQETTNGNYQVSIRGLDNLPPGSELTASTNTISLVMIDNRPVYNYFNGGTFWETLPVDLNDVERIEVVRGASSALYGPNAAAGVINIITRRAQKRGLYTVANVQGGKTSTLISNASVGYSFKRLDVIVSANQQYRQRTESDYYSWIAGKKVPIDSVNTYFPYGPLADQNGVPNVSTRYPNLNVALNKYGYNTFLTYRLNGSDQINLSLGGQGSQAQKAFIENLATPLTTSLSNTNYADLSAKIKGFSGQVSYNGGTQNAALGVLGYKYDFKTLETTLEYDFNLTKNFSIRPGFNYRSAVYNDAPYSAQNGGFLDGSKTLSNTAGSLRAEYSLARIVKLIAAVRADKYNVPNKVYTSYQFIATVKPTEEFLLRATYSRAFRGPTMYNSYNQSNILIQSATPTSPAEYAQVIGSPNLNLLQIDMVELGNRIKLTDNLYTDVDFFYQQSKNYTYLENQPAYPTLNGYTVTGYVIPQTVDNINLVAKQYGATISLNYSVKKIQFKPFVTFQRTNMTGVPAYRSSVSDDPVNNVTVTYSGKSTGTPAGYGGFYLNYNLNSKWHANLNGYYYGSYTYNNLFSQLSSNFGLPQSAGIINTSGKLILNVKVGYNVTEKLEVYMNIRNLSNNRPEFAQTDITSVMILGGLHFSY